MSLDDINVSEHEVKMVWITEKDQWHLTLAENDRFLQEFYDCGKVNGFFMDLDKDGVNYYRVNVEKMEMD